MKKTRKNGFFGVSERKILEYVFITQKTNMTNIGLLDLR